MCAKYTTETGQTFPLSVNNNTFNKIVKPCSRLITARGPYATFRELKPTGSSSIMHTKSTRKTHVTYDLDFQSTS